ncbi:hypothetical protein [uncultured Amphritea sp.]|uniref:hypothetical protein n=1 Tax=uncultured Amphritea sp. TaxID=981605 RepID=UPI002615D002|nr:hypothetical protein [uncultured Amphritea sp.]
MEQNRTIRFLFGLILLVSASPGYAQAPLNCDPAEVPAYVITYDHVVTRLIDEQPDKKGRQVITASSDASFHEEAGEMLDSAAKRRGETVYSSYRKERWETPDAIYTYLSVGDIARVRMHPLIEKNTIPYALLSPSEPVRTIAGFQCNWREEDLAGVQTTQRCEAAFYGWTVPLYTRTIAQGRDILFSEATDISHQCVKKEAVYVPEDRPWKFSE